MAEVSILELIDYLEGQGVLRKTDAETLRSDYKIGKLKEDLSSLKDCDKDALSRAERANFRIDPDLSVDCNGDELEALRLTREARRINELAKGLNMPLAQFLESVRV